MYKYTQKKIDFQMVWYMSDLFIAVNILNKQISLQFYIYIK